MRKRCSRHGTRWEPSRGRTPLVAGVGDKANCGPSNDAMPFALVVSILLRQVALERDIGRKDSHLEVDAVEPMEVPPASGLLNELKSLVGEKKSPVHGRILARVGFDVGPILKIDAPDRSIEVDL